MWPFKKRTGNGTVATQKVYCMINFPWVWAWKVGITGRGVGTRAREINRKNHKRKWYTGWFIPLTWVELFGAYYVEQFLIEGTKFAKTSVFGVGGKEVRLIIPGVFIYLVILVMAIIKSFGGVVFRWLGPPVILYFLLEYF